RGPPGPGRRGTGCVAWWSSFSVATRSPRRCGRVGLLAVPPHLHHPGGWPLVVLGSGVSSRPGASPPSQLPVALSAGGVGALLVSVVALSLSLTRAATRLPVRNVSRVAVRRIPGGRGARLQA